MVAVLVASEPAEPLASVALDLPADPYGARVGACA
jgi:hypothetical protein